MTKLIDLGAASAITRGIPQPPLFLDPFPGAFPYYSPR